MPSDSELVPETDVALLEIGPIIVGQAVLDWQLASLILSIVQPLCLSIISVIWLTNEAPTPLVPPTSEAEDALHKVDLSAPVLSANT